MNTGLAPFRLTITLKVVVSGLLCGVLAAGLCWLMPYHNYRSSNDFRDAVIVIASGATVILCLVASEWLSLRQNAEKTTPKRPTIFTRLLLSAVNYLVGYGLIAAFPFPAIR